MTFDMRAAPSGKGADATTTLNQPPTRIAQPTDVDEALAQIRRWETAARLVADDPALSLKAKCLALIELMARARRSELAAFLEIAVWRGCRHLFEEPEQEVPRGLIDALRRLRHRGLVRCPECFRDLPSHDELDRWRELEHRSLLRRPA